jgi:hypothetical protein
MSPEQRRTDMKLNLRLTKAQYRRLAAAAKANNSTMQREIVRRLDESFDQQTTPWIRDIIEAAALRGAHVASITTSETLLAHYAPDLAKKLLEQPPLEKPFKLTKAP